VRSGFEEMKASPWEKEDAMHEGIPILNFLVPKAFLHEDGKLTGMCSRRCAPSTTPRAGATGADRRARRDPRLRRRAGRGRPGERLPVDRARHPASSSTAGACPVDEGTFQSTHPKVFFGGDAAFGPKNIIWAVAHGHEAAVSIDKFCNGEDHRASARRRARR
jgi:formate dehydrogenase beta subunit